MLNRLKNLQKKGKKAAKRKLKIISKKQQRFQRDKNHCISKAIIETAKRLHYSIKLEDLQGIRDSVKANKSISKLIPNIDDEDRSIKILTPTNFIRDYVHNNYSYQINNFIYQILGKYTIDYC